VRLTGPAKSNFAVFRDFSLPAFAQLRVRVGSADYEASSFAPRGLGFYPAQLDDCGLVIIVAVPPQFSGANRNL
jgi:hypothetical protein